MSRLRVPLASRRVRWSAVVAVAATIFYASVLVDPGSAAGDTLGPYWDKLLHAGAYAILALALAYATAEWRPARYRRVLAVLVATVGYGALIELVQATVPYRQFSPLDVAANGAGALVVLGWFALEAREGSRRTGPDDGDSGSQPRREE